MKKDKIILIAIAAIAVIIVVACALVSNQRNKPNDKLETSTGISSTESNISEDDIADMDFGNVNFFYPANWKTKLSDDGLCQYLYPTGESSDALVALRYDSVGVLDVENTIKKITKEIASDSNIKNYREQQSTKGGRSTIKANYKQVYDDFTYNIETHIVPNENNGVLIISFGVNTSGSYDEYKDGFDKILYSANFISNKAKHIDLENVDGVDISGDESANMFSANLTFSSKWEDMTLIEQGEFSQEIIDTIIKSPQFETATLPYSIQGVKSNGDTAFFYNSREPLKIKLWIDGKYQDDFNIIK